MSPQPRPDDAVLTQTLTVCKIIAGSLVFGVLAFAAIAVVLRRGEPADPNQFVSLIGAGLTFIAVIARQVIVGFLGGQTTSQGPKDAAAALALYQTRMIVGLAILEGAAFFNIVSYLLEGHWWSLAVVAGLLAWMIASFPARARLRQWIDDRDHLKTFGPGGSE